MEKLLGRLKSKGNITARGLGKMGTIAETLLFQARKLAQFVNLSICQLVEYDGKTLRFTRDKGKGVVTLLTAN